MSWDAWMASAKADMAHALGAGPYLVQRNRDVLADEVRDVMDKFPGLAFASLLIRVVEELER